MRKKAKHEKKNKNYLLIAFILICLVGVIYYSFRIITWKKHTSDNEKINNQISNSIRIIKDETGTEDIYDIDFEALKEINSDTIAYVKVNNTNINHIVVKGTNNEYYLNHNLKKEWNNAGWIFADYKNKFDGLDKNIVIYGHNMKDGSMFETLKYTIEKDWYENKENHKVVLVTESGTKYYQVFSTYSTKPEDYYIKTEFNNDIEFEEFLKTLKNRSVYDYGTEVSSQDKILTLSSCLDGRKNRIVLHAKLIQEQ